MTSRRSGNERVWNIISDIDKVTSLAQLDEITNAVIARRRDLQKIRAQELYRKLSVGDRIILTPHMKPAYLGEAEGEILEVFTDPKARKRIATRVRLLLDKDAGYRRHSGRPIVVPIIAVSKRTSRAKV